MPVSPSADGLSGSAEPIEELAGRMRATGAGAPSLGPRWLSLSGLRGPKARSGAASAEERR